MTPKLLFSSLATEERLQVTIFYSLTGYDGPCIEKLWFVYLIRRRQQFRKMRGLPQTSQWFFLVALTGDAGFFPPPVCLWEAPYFVCSFFAALTIPRHLSFTSATLRRHTPSEFTLAVISSQTFVLFLFVKAEENLFLITERFCSAASQIKAHSAAVKFGLRPRFLRVSPARAVHVVYHHDNRTDGNLSGG